MDWQGAAPSGDNLKLTMARYRHPPACPFCKKVIAKAVMQSRPSWQHPMIGDNFSHWKYEKHDCKKKKEFEKNLKKSTKEFGLLNLFKW